MISSLCLSMISAQTLRVCREGKPVPTFPDHAPMAGYSGKPVVQKLGIKPGFRIFVGHARRRMATSSANARVSR
jgi:hypothetical protein